MKPVYVLHEYGAPRHFLPHEYLDRRGDIVLKHLPPLSTPRSLIRCLRTGEFAHAPEHLADSVELARLAGMRNETIILGVAPFNGWIGALRALKRHNRLILFTSWPHWALGTAVHHTRSWPLAQAWWKFLDGLEVVAVTDSVAQTVQKYGAKTTVIPHAYDPQHFFPSGLESDGRLQALFVGRMVAQKGVHEILEAAISRPNIDWKFAGEGPLSAAVDAAALKHSHIQSLGFLNGDNLPQAYQKTHVLVQPSIRTPGWEELFGIAIIEAMACGATCIASDNVGPASIIMDGQTGLLLPAITSQTIGQAIDVLDLDRSKLKTLRLSACAHAQQEYELSHVAEQWLRLING
jgi:glycosyltransferase involved in cell wall biosynthesis